MTIDDLVTESNVVSSLFTLLDEHFSSKRYDDKTMDWYQLQRNINEYADLLWTIQKKVNMIEEELIRINERKRI